MTQANKRLSGKFHLFKSEDKLMSKKYITTPRPSTLACSHNITRTTAQYFECILKKANRHLKTHCGTRSYLHFSNTFHNLRVAFRIHSNVRGRRQIQKCLCTKSSQVLICLRQSDTQANQPITSVSGKACSPFNGDLLLT